MSPRVPSRCRALRVGASALILGTGLGSLLALATAQPGRAQTALASETSIAGNKGAQVYCYMRSNGNIHEVSWAAAYALIKRQGSNLFKTSPEHAAVMITEAVVQNPSTYPDCGRYLGDLYTRRRTVVVSQQSPGPAGQAGAATGAVGGGSQTRW
jgi:hypothetical protein